MKRTARHSQAEPMLLRTRDAAAMLSVSERSIWHLIRSGELRATPPVGMRAIRIARRDVENLVERRHNHEDAIAGQHP
jgi:excisionase family DNA binding protein